MADASTGTFAVEETDHLWIEMPDGVRLAARLWRPRTDAPVPAILEIIPYRKTDMVRARDERNHPVFAAHGYACLRIDMRGSGDSEGHMPDMYAPAELDDTRRVIAWIAAQDWCCGRVGMVGTSWGGTAALQASADAPDALKTVVAVCATHDRFEDDIHHMGGSVLSDTLEWGATLPAILGSPPTPHVGPNWQARWRARIEELAFPLEAWLREGARGRYWRHGSVIHAPEALSVPILAVGGWSDRYSNSVMALVEARPDRVWGVIGPWGHHYPDHGTPGPAIGFQRLALDWWDHWLRPEAPPEPDWPHLRVWLREHDPPADRLAERKGSWIESGPPSRHTETERLDLRDLAEPGPWALPEDPGIGATSGDTGYFGRPGGLAHDQAPDDARSLVFETAPLTHNLILYGVPELQLDGRTDTGGGQIVARLSEVTPEGSVARVSYGVRNLALDARLDLRETRPGPFAATLRMHSTAHRVQRGHRLRLALSAALWPLVCSPDPAAEIHVTGGELHLPRMKGAPVPLRHPLPPPEDLQQDKRHTVLAAPPLERWHNKTEDGAELGWHQPLTRTAYRDTDTVFGFETRAVHRLRAAGSAAEAEARTDIDHRLVFERPDGMAEVSIRLQARSANGTHTVEAWLEARWNGEPFAERRWRIPPGGPAQKAT